MAIDYEKLKYIIMYCRGDFEIMIERVLEDTEDDPQYSAVTTTNLIKCYIEIMVELGEKLPYANVEEFFDLNGFSKEELLLFEKKRKIESEYYIGVQY